MKKTIQNFGLSLVGVSLVVALWASLSGTVAKDLPYVPEISANRYALNIRFVGFDNADRPRQIEQDIEFDLTFCNL